MLKTENYMCTAIFDNKYGAFFGRTLDLECSYGEKVMRVAKGESLNFIHEGMHICKHSILGMAHYTGSQPLFYDAVNDAGLSAAALNFPMYASYHKPARGRTNLASFELISYILSRCASVGEVIHILDGAVITPDDFSPTLKSTPLHWMIADKTRCIVAESVAEGLKIYDDPFGVMTNSPPFPYHSARICELAYLSPETQKNNLLPDYAIEPYSRGLGAHGLPGDYSSASRFARALFAKQNTLLPFCAEDMTQIAAAKRRIFDILGTVFLPFGITRAENGKPIYTVYTSCIDMERCEYSYFTFESREVRTVGF